MNRFFLPPSRPIWSQALRKGLKRRAMAAVLVSTMVLVTGCGDKFDYRHKYLGFFQFHSAYSLPPFGEGDVVAETDYDGHVFLGDEGELQIHWLETRIDSVNVDESGKLQRGAIAPGSSLVSGEFSTRRKVAFRISNYDLNLGQEFERWDITGTGR